MTSEEKDLTPDEQTSEQKTSSEIVEEAKKGPQPEKNETASADQELPPLPNDGKEEYWISLQNARKLSNEHEFNLLEDTAEVRAGASFKMFFVNEASIQNLGRKFGDSVFTNDSLVETALKELMQKQVLFIQGANQDWLEIAVANFQIHIGKVWPDAAPIRRVLLEKETSFGFWKHMSGVNRPTILVINDENYEHFRSFMRERLGNITDVHKIKLKQANLYLIFQIPDDVGKRQILRDFSTPERRAEFAWWEVPVIQEEIIKAYGEIQGLQLFAEIKDEGLLKYGQTEVYLALRDLLYTHDIEGGFTDGGKSIEADQFVEKLKESIRKREDDLKPVIRDLRSIFDTGDTVQRLLIFCTAFFPNLSYSDFRKLMLDLLGDEAAKDKTVDDEDLDLQILKEKDPEIRRFLLDRKNSKKSTALLRDVFLEEFYSRLKECKIEILKEGRERKRKLQFSYPKAAIALREYILQQYIFFTEAYERFISAGLLFEPSLTEAKLKAYVNFIVEAAKNDEEQHNAEWLTDMIVNIKKQLTLEFPSELTFQALLKHIEVNAKLQDVMNMLIGRVTELVKAILLTGNEDMKEMVRSFFRLLLNQKEVREIALRMALTLHRNLSEEPDFDKELVLTYFKRVLDEGDLEQKKFAYRLLINYFAGPALFEITQEWISDTRINPASNTQKIAYYYCLDYSFLVFTEFFGKENKSEDVTTRSNSLVHNYLFFQNANDDNFEKDFLALIRLLSSEPCYKAWYQISQDFGAYRQIVLYLEKVVSGELPPVERFNQDNSTPIALLGDVLENWFFLLVQSWHESQPENEGKSFVLKTSPSIHNRWKLFAGAICDGLFPKEAVEEYNGFDLYLMHEEENPFVQLINYLSRKLDLHLESASVLLDAPKITGSILKKQDLLQTRYICVSLLADLIRAEIETHLQ